MKGDPTKVFFISMEDVLSEDLSISGKNMSKNEYKRALEKLQKRFREDAAKKKPTAQKMPSRKTLVRRLHKAITFIRGEMYVKYNREFFYDLYQSKGEFNRAINNVTIYFDRFANTLKLPSLSVCAEVLDHEGLQLLDVVQAQMFLKTNHLTKSKNEAMERLYAHSNFNWPSIIQNRRLIVDLARAVIDNNLSWCGFLRRVTNLFASEKHNQQTVAQVCILTCF
jgi:hypothetical protein